MSKSYIYNGMRPLSVNTLYRHRGNRVYMTKRGKEWMRDFVAATEEQGIVCFGECSINCHIELKGKRTIDIDNCMKIILDGLEKAGVLLDDKYVLKMEVDKVNKSDMNLIECTIENWNEEED